MKFSLIASLLLVSISGFAKTTLRIPLFIVGAKNKLIPMEEINKKYKTKLMSEIVVTDEKGSSEKAHDAFWKLSETLSNMEGELNLVTNIPGSKGTCYTGKPEVAVDLAASLADSVYSDQLGFWGWKFKKEVHLADDQDSDEMLDLLNEGSKLWKNWKGTDDSILIVSHESDGGDDMNEGIITKCK